MKSPGGAGLRQPESEGLRPDDASLGFFGPGGPFEHHPGPVLVVARGGEVLGCNAAGEALAKLVKHKTDPDLSGAIETALLGKPAQLNPFLLPAAGESGEPGQALDLVALPWTVGAAAVVLGRDITLERSLRGALIESRERYKDLVEASSDFAWETDNEGRFVFVSPRGALGHSAATLIGRHHSDFLAEGGGEGGSPFVTQGPVDQVEVWLRNAAGEPACLLAIARPLLDAGGAWRGARGTCREITEDRQRDAELARGHHRERLLAYILRMVRDELEPQRMLLAAAGALLPALPALGVVIYGRRRGGELEPLADAGRHPPAEPLKALLDQISDGRAAAEARHESGQILVRATSYQGEVNGVLCVWRAAGEETLGEEGDILLEEVAAQVGVANQQMAREFELERLSATDPLTGLLNRRGFTEQLERRLARAHNKGGTGALFYVDLDNFKPVNDRFGHHAGDRALVAVSKLLRAQIRSGDLAGRLGGDEFGLYFPEMSPDQAARKGEALIAATTELLEYSVDGAHPLGFSVGIAIYDGASPEDFQSLMHRSDEAMYKVKHAGKGGYRVADRESGTP